jgi:hypothetical protein
LELEAGQPIGGLPQRILCSCGLGGRLFRLLGFEVALDLELAQIADERPGFTRQSIRFTLKGANAIGDAVTLISGRWSLRRLRSWRGLRSWRRLCSWRSHGSGQRGGSNHHCLLDKEEKMSEECENYTSWDAWAGLDVGERRIGVAVSDVTGTLARPVGVLQTSGLERDAVDRAVT